MWTLLNDMRYRVHRTCALCKFGNFKSGDVGVCNRDMPIAVHKCGRCLVNFELDKGKFAQLEEFGILLKE